MGGPLLALHTPPHCQGVGVGMGGGLPPPGMLGGQLGRAPALPGFPRASHPAASDPLRPAAPLPLPAWVDGGWEGDLRARVKVGLRGGCFMAPAVLPRTPPQQPGGRRPAAAVRAVWVGAGRRLTGSPWPRPRAAVSLV